MVNPCLNFATPNAAVQDNGVPMLFIQVVPRLNSREFLPQLHGSLGVAFEGNRRWATFGVEQGKYLSTYFKHQRYVVEGK